jgi:hypothetical protein
MRLVPLLMATPAGWALAALDAEVDAESCWDAEARSVSLLQSQFTSSRASRPVVQAQLQSRNGLLHRSAANSSLGSASGGGSHASAGQRDGQDFSSQDIVGLIKWLGQAKPVFWIAAYARSGSSTVLSLTTSSSLTVFSLFEPCHTGDLLEPYLEAQGCGALLLQIASCNFTGINKLWGWSNGHSKTNGAGSYSPGAAAGACAAADLVAFKTIHWGHRLEAEAFPVLSADPRIRMVNLIRDPRSIFASQTFSPGSTYQQLVMGTDGIVSMCDNMCENLAVRHPQVHHLHYESLVTSVNSISAALFGFLGIPVDENVRSFVQANFDGDCGDTSGTSTSGFFGDCRMDSSASVTKYKGILSNNEYAAFMAHESCRNVSKAYGYDTWYYDSAATRTALLQAWCWLPFVALAPLWLVLGL